MANVNWHRKMWKVTEETVGDEVLVKSEASNEFWLSPLAEGSCFVLVSEPGAMTDIWQKKILFPRGTEAFTGAFTDTAERLESLPDAQKHVLQLYVQTDEDAQQSLTARWFDPDGDGDDGLATGVPSGP